MLSVADALVSSWDLAGRPYALVRETGTYRRGLDGGLLRKREATAGSPRLRQRLTAAEGAGVVEAARRDALAALAALDRARVAPAAASVLTAARERLRQAAAMDAAALAADAARFDDACGRVGILPPDQYLALVVRLTEGCSWDACTFCTLYAGQPFRARTRDEVERHAASLLAYFGESIALRPSVFLGDANALCLANDRLLPLLDVVATAFPGRPLFSFVDAWSGRRKTAAEWRACRERGLRRVYVGLETGDPGLLGWLGKPGTPEDAVALVHALREAGIGAGVIVLLGAGGERFDAAHVSGTAAVLRQLVLGRDDIVYFSEYVPDPASRYGPKAAGAPDLAPLDRERVDAQHRAIAAAFDGLPRDACPRTATYDLREFVY